MKTVFNRRRHPITPDEAPAIPAFQTGEIDETLGRNAALIDAGDLQVLAETPAPLTGDALTARAADLDIKGRSSMSADELRAAIAVAEQNPEKED